MNIVQVQVRHCVTCICHSNHDVDSWSGLLLVWQKIVHQWYVTATDLIWVSDRSGSLGQFSRFETDGGDSVQLNTEDIHVFRDVIQSHP